MVIPARYDWDMPGPKHTPGPDWLDEPIPASEGESNGARVCAVPGCHDPPAGRIPLCRAHRICPRCGAGIHVHGRVSLDCCGLLVALVPRRAWAIPWLQLIQRLRESESWPHRIRRVRVVLGHRTLACRLPWLEEK